MVSARGGSIVRAGSWLLKTIRAVRAACSPWRDRAIRSAIEARDLVTLGEAELARGQLARARHFATRALSVEPLLDVAWLLRAASEEEPEAGRVWLRAGLAVNPYSALLKQALGEPAANRELPRGEGTIVPAVFGGPRRKRPRPIAPASG